MTRVKVSWRATTFSSAGFPRQSPTITWMHCRCSVALTVHPERSCWPLTYGNGPYRDAVINAARECLGERFLPLVDFVSPDEYANLLRPCGHVVMNHRRQQAVGNIFAALWRGARVYLNDTTVCKALTRQGFEIEQIDDGLGVTRATALRPCSDEQARYHRDLLPQAAEPQEGAG